MRQVLEVEEVERHAKAEFAIVLAQFGGTEKLALFDMDGTLLRDRSIVAIGRETGRLDEILQFLDNPDFSPADRAAHISRCLTGVPRRQFVDIARAMTLSDGAADTVVALRKRGYRVGIVSDSYRIVTETVRRRVFADFSIGNLLRFRDGSATGQLSLAPIFLHPDGCQQHPVCKWNVLLHLEEKFGIPASRVLAVGDSLNDLCLLKRAGVGIAYEPKTDEVENAANYVVRGDMRQVLEICARAEEVVA